jgi:hypothetical protein
MALVFGPTNMGIVIMDSGGLAKERAMECI